MVSVTVFGKATYAEHCLDSRSLGERSWERNLLRNNRCVQQMLKSRIAPLSKVVSHCHI